MKKLLGIVLVIMLTACCLMGCAANTNGTVDDNNGLLSTEVPSAQSTNNTQVMPTTDAPAGTNAPAAGNNGNNNAGDIGGTSVG